MFIKIDNEAGRIDKVLESLTEYSRSKIKNMINSGLILVNDDSVKVSYKVQKDDEIEITEVEEIDYAYAEDIPLNIVYEDNDVIVVNKPSGMVVHPGAGNKSGTLVNGLLNHSKLSDINGAFRPGIVHRIDKDTSGLLMVAKNNLAHEKLAKQLEEKTTTRKYIALVWGVIKEESGTIKAPIKRMDNKKEVMTVAKGGKDATTHFKVLERYPNATKIECQLETGRTHQIRVHMNYINHPIVNDPVYGNHKKINDLGQCLHAKILGFIHPSNNEYMEFDSDLPDKILDIIEVLKNGK